MAVFNPKTHKAWNLEGIPAILEKENDELFDDLFDVPIDVIYIPLAVDTMTDDEDIDENTNGEDHEDENKDISGTFEIHNLCKSTIEKRGSCQYASSTASPSSKKIKKVHPKDESLLANGVPAERRRTKPSIKNQLLN